MEEFLESEVLWPETCSESTFSEERKSNSTNRHHRQGSRHGNGSTPSSPPSSPITIPCSSDLHNSHESRKWCNEEECPESLVPPHVMMSRKSNGGKMEFSLRSGQGRTLRGRELWHIRNTVWRMTGFVDE